MILLEYMVPLQISDFGMTREVESEMYYKLGKDFYLYCAYTYVYLYLSVLGAQQMNLLDLNAHNISVAMVV